MTAPVRPLSEAEYTAFRLGRLIAAEHLPYFMHALFAASPVAAPGLGTFAVDASWRLYLDPDLLTGEHRWDSTTVGAVLAHEVGHLLRDHAARAECLPAPRHHLAWNLSTDAETNDDLLAAGVPLPPGVITPSGLGCDDGDLAEAYYAHLLRQRQHPDDGSPGCGSGAGSLPVPGELPAGVALGDGSAGALDPAEAELVRRRVAREVQETESRRGRGSVPAGLSRWAGAVLRPPTVPWQTVLRSAVRRAVADRAGLITYSYRRPSRRRLPRIVKPAMRAPVVAASIVIDTSGSMSPSDLDAAMSEVSGVLHSSGIAREHVRLLSCDAAATTARRIRSVAGLTLSGGGGTDMRVGIAAAESAHPAPDVVVVLTDGDTPWPDRPTRARLVCAVISTTATWRTPPWATTVHIVPDAPGDRS